VHECNLGHGNVEATTSGPRALDTVSITKVVGATLQSDILKTLLYFDIFDFPLRLPEIHQFLPSNSVAKSDLRTACLSYPLNETIAAKGDYYFLKERSEEIVANRLENERRARRFWSVARLVARTIGSFPFVRAVFVSGELSKGVASKNSDIDFFIVAGVHRVWIVRTLCAVFKRIVLFNQKKFFCYNHIVSESQLGIEERNIYTAIETISLKPLLNIVFFQKLLEINSWTRHFLPNSLYQAPETVDIIHGMPIIEKIVVFLIPKSVLNSFDDWLLGKWRRTWIHRYPSLASQKRSELFRCTTNVSTSYVNDYSTKILEQYRLRLNKYGLSQDRP
jgi:hypothetical protein